MPEANAVKAQPWKVGWPPGPPNSEEATQKSGTQHGFKKNEMVVMDGNIAPNDGNATPKDGNVAPNDGNATSNDSDPPKLK